jgi:enoyl-CoA hydratase/carnithine racemase
MTEAATLRDAPASDDSRPPSLTVAAGRATIRLNRPRVHNRVEPEDLDVLHDLLGRIEADPSLRVVVLTAGGRSFSSGFHIGEIGGSDKRGEGGFEKLADRMEALRLPTICALQGGVYGGSTDLALACDFRIGVTGIAAFMPAARLGLHYYLGGMRRYVTRLGLDTAKRMFLTAEKLDAETMLRIGFLTELVAPEALEARVDALAATLAGHAPLAVQGMKVALNAIARGDADPAAIDAAQRVALASADLKEGRAAWLEKRTPHFQGK